MTFYLVFMAPPAEIRGSTSRIANALRALKKDQSDNQHVVPARSAPIMHDPYLELEQIIDHTLGALEFHEPRHLAGTNRRSNHKALFSSLARAHHRAYHFGGCRLADS